METTRSSRELPEFYYTFQPVSWWIGVIDAPREVVACKAADWLRPTQQWVGQEHHSGGIAESLHALQPLGLAEKLLLADTADSRTAVFSNALFDAVAVPTAHLGFLLRCGSTSVCCQPNTIRKVGLRRWTGAYGATTLETFGVDHDGTHRSLRAVSSANDGGSWQFIQTGRPFSFEELSAYEAKSVRERFTPAMLRRYCAALGVPVFDEAFYGTEHTLVSRTGIADGPRMTFLDARAFLGVGGLGPQ